MTTRANHRQFRAGDRISERAARRAIAQFRTAAVNGAPPAPSDPANATVNDRRDTRRSAADPQILRRWVLADLIADASRRRVFA
jgi:hypothetical protein